jgi:hypothetical protein
MSSNTDVPTERERKARRWTLHLFRIVLAWVGVSFILGNAYALWWALNRCPGPHSCSVNPSNPFNWPDWAIAALFILVEGVA